MHCVGVGAVSYTHPDVYKRQVIFCTESYFQPFCNLSGKVERHINTFVFIRTILQNTILSFITNRAVVSRLAVSYTHLDCGAKHMDSEQMIEVMKKRGIPSEHIDMMRYCGIDFKSWLRGFDTPEGSVRETVAQVQKHPLIPKDITVRGFVIDSTTGELATVV